MDTREKEQILKELAVFEQEETSLISLYQMLNKVGEKECLPQEHQATYRQGLEKLHQESIKHRQTVLELLVKYKKIKI